MTIINTNSITIIISITITMYISTIITVTIIFTRVLHSNCYALVHAPPGIQGVI